MPSLKSEAKEAKETPLMKQYNEIKRRYPDACLLFRVGDFYETFGEDAIRASKILGIVLTKRGAGSETETAPPPDLRIGSASVRVLEIPVSQCFPWRR